jgi:hypothetical protein
VSKDLFFFSFLLTNINDLYTNLSKTKNIVDYITKCRILEKKKTTKTINVIDNINIKIDITTVLNLKLLFLNCKKSQMPIRYYQFT